MKNYKFLEIKRLCYTIAVISCLSLFTLCSEDSESFDVSGQDVSQDISGSEVSANVEGMSSEDLSEDFESVNSSSAVFAATSMAIESEEVYTMIDSPSPVPAPPAAMKSVGNECVKKDIKTDSVLLNYDQCTHAAGNIRLIRQGLGKWLIQFEDNFSIFKVKIAGFILLSRKEKGLFSFFDAKQDGQKGGELTITWQGRNSSITRNLSIDGEIKSVEAPASLFNITGDGFIINQASRENKMNLSIGGMYGETKANPAQFPRPLDSRCPYFGILSLRGKQSAKVSSVLAFEIAKQIYKLNVDLGTFSANADTGIKFNKDKSGKIEELKIKVEPPIMAGDKSVTESFTVPVSSIQKALAESSLPQNIKDAINSYINTRQISITNIGQLFSDSLVESFKKQYMSDFCNL
ncbi:MAG: hypothetical protein N3B13_09705 [Deltaproteobacteria bacterium]|nr:hypothetical protein [Deltaproteobacteria bacterium]